MTFSRFATTATLLITALSVGCASDTGTGALIGTGVGALAGGVIGHQSGHTGAGMLIGGAVGAGTGALIGHASDEHKREEREAYERGRQDALRYEQRSSANPPRAGYTSYSESTRTGVGSGGYYRDRETSVRRESYYGR